jgi:ElaB/YqjD/DUF883 family membrane-anchored ribosome-binding protein
MSGAAQRLVRDLEQLVSGLDALLSQAKEEAGERIGDRLDEAASGVHETIEAAQHRLNELQDELRRRVGATAKAAEDSIRRNPWGTVAIAAAAAFLLGLALARGSSESASGSETSDDGESARGAHRY